MSTAEQSGAARVVSVTIYNQSYQLRSTADGEYVRQVAALVDARMRAAAEHLHGVDALKTAVLAALNIADELCRIQAQTAPQPTSVPTQPSEAEQANPARAAEQAWSYEDIFEALPAGPRPMGRMSAQVASRLQTIRQAQQDEANILTRGDEP